MSASKLQTLWDIMQVFPVAELLDATCSLSNFGVKDAPLGNRVIIPEPNHRDILKKAEAAERICRELGLPAAWASANTLLTIIRDDVEPASEMYGSARMVQWSPLNFGRLKNYAGELSSRVRDELSGRFVFEIPLKMRELFEQSEPPFGLDVANRFPSTEYDVEEAGKCLALGRSTACVFHLMRAAEGAARVVSASLGGDTHNDKDEPLTFGGLFNQISSKIEAMPQGVNKDAWIKLRGFMSSINRGSRTKVAHPGTNYTEEQAERLFGATRSFMEEAEGLLRP